MRGTIAGSVVSTALIVLGVAIVYGGGGAVDRPSLGRQIGVLGDRRLPLPDPVDPRLARRRRPPQPLPADAAGRGAAARALRRDDDAQPAPAPRLASRRRRRTRAWSLRAALTALTVATVATAFVSEALVGSITEFGEQLGLSQFFVAAVIVALVGNAAEHGGAIVTARRGHAGLAAEIAVSSSTQVAVFVAPVIALLSGLVGRGLPLAFRPVEIADDGRRGDRRRTRRSSTAARSAGRARVLVLGYAVVVVAFWIAGER